jgi:hypothetical protein
MNPLVILTTEDVQTKEDAGRVVDSYLERWGIEEANRFTKQGFDLEDVRALTWTGLQRMVQLVHLAYGFLALLVHRQRKQVERVAASFKAFGPVPEYMYYRLLRASGSSSGTPWMEGHKHSCSRSRLAWNQSVKKKFDPETSQPYSLGHP